MKTVVIVPSNEEELLQNVPVTDNSDIARLIIATSNEDILNVVPTILFRGPDPLYVHHLPHSCGTPNLRGTYIAMMCGKFALRLNGTVVFAGARSNVSLEQLPLYNQPQRPLGSWMGDAAQSNYHDQVVLQELARVMTTPSDGNDDDKDTASTDLDCSSKDDHRAATPPRTVVTKRPLCYHCRRPTFKLCEGCQGVYFCNSSCQQQGWSHACLCPTFAHYTDNRAQLASFPFGPWSRQTTGRAFQLSDRPYEDFLRECLLIDIDAASFWRTELYGWKGGESESAKAIDITVRRSYREGFAPITDIPPERPITEDDIKRVMELGERNELGLMILSSWEQYYRLRNIGWDSAVALLLTFPLTLYYAIVKYGSVPYTVSKMLRRRLRIHVVGVEKELNLLDSFKETSFLLQDKLQIELVFVVRQDMLPVSLRSTKDPFELEVTDSLKVVVVHGTYGDSLDPNFDVGSGPPDMIVGFNAGLYAYESWRSVIDFLRDNHGVVGVFTDYNEFSGMQCASLGGHKSRQSLTMNPFRQPRAMPVYSMNLPQFSNGFLYIFNPQELD